MYIVMNKQVCSQSVFKGYIAVAMVQMQIFMLLNRHIIAVNLLVLHAVIVILKQFLQ